MEAKNSMNTVKMKQKSDQIICITKSLKSMGVKSITVILALLFSVSNIFSQSVVVNLDETRQTIRGFGGMTHRVWTGYDLSPSDRDLAFGNGPGQMGLTVLRVWVSPNESQWNLEVATARDVIARGGIVIASAWTAPDHISDPYTFQRWGNTVNSFKIPPQNYAAYVEHLNRFVRFMRDNGAPVYAISFQNEPDWADGWTHWTIDEVFNFTRNYAAGLRQYGAKVITAESFHYNKAYYDRILRDPVALGNIDIIGSHFYSSYANTPNSFFHYPLADSLAPHLERWMTEHYSESQGNANLWRGVIVTGDQDVTPRLDTVRALDVAFGIHRALVEANKSLYAWWYIRRNYSFIMNDTQDNVRPFPATAAEVGRVTKRGYCMAQFSKFIRPGAVRVEATRNPIPGVYVSAFSKADSVVIVVVNRTLQPRTLNFSIPDGSNISSWRKHTTSETKNLSDDGAVSASNGSFSTTFDLESVTTLVGIGIAQQDTVTIPGRIEAESFASMFGLELRDNAVGGGRHIAHINSGDSARYLINVQSAGEYLLRVRAATAIDANSTITFRNSAGVVLATVTVDASQTNGWQEWYVATARITLPAGAQDLRVAFTGGTGYLCNVDWFEIVPVPVTIPGRVQAENFASMQGVQVEPDAGGVLNVGWINQGDWVRYLVDVSETGRYVMRFRVATAATANSSVVVRNQAGTILGTLVIDTARSNGWHDWYVDSIMVDLNVGLQELTLEFTGTDFLFNVDWFELSQPTTSVSVMREFETVGYSVWSAPNPFIDEVVIFVEAESSHEGLKVEIYNIRGEKVFESRVGSSGKIVVPNAANLQRGIYYIVLSNRNQKLAVRSLLKIN